MKGVILKNPNKASKSKKCSRRFLSFLSGKCFYLSKANLARVKEKPGREISYFVYYFHELSIMETIVERSKITSRGLLFSLLVNCIFSTGARDDCPLRQLRDSLTIQQKPDYVMGLDDAELERILIQHERSYENRSAELQ